MIIIQARESTNWPPHHHPQRQKEELMDQIGDRETDVHDLFQIRSLEFHTVFHYIQLHKCQPMSAVDGEWQHRNECWWLCNTSVNQKTRGLQGENSAAAM